MGGTVSTKSIQKNMDFEIRNKTATLQVLETKGDGNCLLRAMARQLFGEKMGSPTQAKSVSKLRSDVVDFIQENVAHFRHELKNTIYDRNNGVNIEDMENECARFLNDGLRRNGVWARVESIKAVSLLHKVNIFIVHENSSWQMPYGFNQEYIECIILAYRLASSSSSADSTGANLVRNHYDSVYSIDQKYLFSSDHDSVVDNMHKFKKTITTKSSTSTSY